MGQPDTRRGPASFDRAEAIRIAAVMLGFTLIYFQNAWVHDDAHITFRSIEQLFAGFCRH